MAKQIEFDKFLIIECTARELSDGVGSYVIVCDSCGASALPSDKGYYIAVLNRWYCEECYKDWCEHAVWYADDVDIERRNFLFYGFRLGINVSKC